MPYKYKYDSRLYKLRRDDPFWDDWLAVTNRTAELLFRYKNHCIRIVYNKQDMLVYKRNLESKERKKALGAATPKTW